jgi:hypothetical protein
MKRAISIKMNQTLASFVMLLSLVLTILPTDMHAATVVDISDFGCGGGPHSPWDIYDDFHHGFTYSSNWRTHTGTSGPYQTTDHYSHTGGATVYFKTEVHDDVFSYIILGYSKNVNYGLADVFFDGVYVETLDLYSPSAQYQCERGYELDSHTGGAHRLNILVRNQRGPHPGTGTYVFLDYVAFSF